jgi:hypothetical protein
VDVSNPERAQLASLSRWPPAVPGIDFPSASDDVGPAASATGTFDLALHLATAIVGHLPEPDPDLRRARYVGRLAHLVARLEALGELRPGQAARLAGAKAALGALGQPSRNP